MIREEKTLQRIKDWAEIKPSRISGEDDFERGVRKGMEVARKQALDLITEDENIHVYQLNITRAQAYLLSKILYNSIEDYENNEGRNIVNGTDWENALSLHNEINNILMNI